jgi:hypothetical protein
MLKKKMVVDRWQWQKKKKKKKEIKSDCGSGSGSGRVAVGSLDRGSQHGHFDTKYGIIWWQWQWQWQEK